jgi:hypothetical protein
VRLYEGRLVNKIIRVYVRGSNIRLWKFILSDGLYGVSAIFYDNHERERNAMLYPS